MAIDKLFSNVGQVKPVEERSPQPVQQPVTPPAPQVNEQAARNLVRQGGSRSVAGNFRSIESFTGGKANVDPRGLALIASVKGQSPEARAEGRGDQVNSLSWAFVEDKGEVA